MGKVLRERHWRAMMGGTETFVAVLEGGPLGIGRGGEKGKGTVGSGGVSKRGRLGHGGNWPCGHWEEGVNNGGRFVGIKKEAVRERTETTQVINGEGDKGNVLGVKGLDDMGVGRGTVRGTVELVTKAWEMGHIAGWAALKVCRLSGKGNINGNYGSVGGGGGGKTEREVGGATEGVLGDEEVGGLELEVMFGLGDR
jgi:hypothetical protein